MARLFNGSSYLSSANTPLTALPLTVSFWFRNTRFNPTSETYLVALSNASSWFNFDYAPNGQGIYFWVKDSGSSNYILGQADTPNTWNHVCGVFASATDRTMYLNGNPTSDARSCSPTFAALRLSIGAEVTGGTGIVESGTEVAEVACWNAALTPDEANALLHGISPTRVRPTALQMFYPLDGSTGYLQNKVRNSTTYPLTVTSTAPTVTSHPPVQTPYGVSGGGWRGNKFTPNSVLVASDLAVGAPVLGAPGSYLIGTDAYSKAGADAGTTDATGYTAVPNTLLGVSLIEGATLGTIVTAANLATSSPAIGVGAFKQVHALAAPTLAVGAPVIGTPALKQAHTFTAPALAVAAPALGVPVMAAKVLLAAPPALAVGSPVLDAPALGQSFVTVGVSFAVSSPTIGSSTLGQAHALTAATLAVGSPAIGASALGQRHVLTAAALAVAAPVLSSAGTGSIFNVAAASLVITSPALGTPALGQTHALIGAWTPRSPVLGTGTLHQKQVFVGTGFAVTSPAFTNPVSSQGRPIPGLGFAVASPVIGAGTLKQTHALAVSAFAVTAPVIGQPVLAKSLFAVSLVTSAPVIAAVPPGLLRSYVLLASGLAVGAPTFLPPPNAEEIAPPVVWLRCKVERWSRDPHSKFYDDDNTQRGKPVKQAIFANLNDAIEATMSSGTLGGRTSAERGPMETIVPSKPLWMADKKLQIDWSEVEQLRAEVTALRTDLERLLGQLKTFIPEDLTVGAPEFSAPQLGIVLPVAASSTVRSPVFGRPALALVS